MWVKHLGQLCVLSPLVVEIDVCEKEHRIGGLHGGIHIEDLGVNGTEIRAAIKEGGGGDVARLFLGGKRRDHSHLSTGLPGSGTIAVIQGRFGNHEGPMILVSLIWLMRS
jgi:hypothetical protein